MNVAYLAQGKLYLHRADQPTQEIDSEFGQSLQARHLQIERRQALRNRNMQALMQPAQSQQTAEASIPIHITSLCRDDAGQLLYTLESDNMGGLFRYDLKQDREQRLFHNNEFRIGHLDFSPQHNLLTCTKTYPTGITNLATLDPNSHRPMDLTEGDSVDVAPRWVAHKEKAIVYQSAGVSRNSQGYVANRKPFAILELDFKRQNVNTLAEDPKSDLLGPQCTEDGWLYYIRRPYKSGFANFSVKQFFKDILLMPFRLAYAFFQFLNIFSTMVTGQPLINAVTGEKLERKKIRTLGGLFTPENLPKQHQKESEAPALVPASWQLVRQKTKGSPEVLANHVLAYDLADDGSVIYTNGSGVYRLQPGQKGKRDHILRDQLIESVIALGST